MASMRKEQGVFESSEFACLTSYVSRLCALAGTPEFDMFMSAWLETEKNKIRRKADEVVAREAPHDPLPQLVESQGVHPPMNIEDVRSRSEFTHCVSNTLHPTHASVKVGGGVYASPLDLISGAGKDEWLVIPPEPNGRDVIVAVHGGPQCLHALGHARSDTRSCTRESTPHGDEVGEARQHEGCSGTPDFESVETSAPLSSDDRQR